MMKTIVLAGGCFWGLQKFFDQFDGLKTDVGYANGRCANPSYEMVCHGSGHAEAVRIEYPDHITLEQILAAFLAVIDPVSYNRQGNDIGINYRTGIYCTDKDQPEIAQTMLKDLEKRIHQKSAVEAMMLENYYPAEDYHQKYLDKNPTGYCHIPRNLLSGHALPSLEETLEAYPGLKK